MKLRLVTFEIKNLEIMSLHLLQFIQFVKVSFKQNHLHFNVYTFLFIK
jgi:hypothetical protein